jgi:hypothetical protein
MRLEMAIRVAHKRTRQTYGAERLQRELAKDGIRVGFHSMGDVIVIGNYIGTDASGTKAIGNGGNGIVLTEGTHHSFVGQSTTLSNGTLSLITKSTAFSSRLAGVISSFTTALSTTHATASIVATTIPGTSTERATTGATTQGETGTAMASGTSLTRFREAVELKIAIH